ncbi:MAG: 2-oxoacid:ferredoxin oxidoreductase subunit beta [Rhodospirillales bacterium]|jgi:2-oxoglutarate/2-oxoacid ferredoxin oxidoreductase subunit beta|nr:2-oxoacid:ferredoxin oxidoreductase subunit beta [Rhodospirillales bacterium]
MTTTYTPTNPVWCSGCGHYGVKGAMERSLAQLGIAPHETMLLTGIGCSGSVQNNINAYGYHSMHGRVLPTATGAALANPELTVIAAGGDGDGYAIGGGHLVHALKRNASVLYILMNNAVYGLTKGQNSPTSGTAVDAVADAPIDGVSMGLAIPGTTFLARGFTRDADQLNDLMTKALEHVRAKKGFAFLEVLSPCVTYNDTFPDWDARVHNVDADPDYAPNDRGAAFVKTMNLNSEGKIPTGLIYHEDRPCFEAELLKNDTSPAQLSAHDPKNHLDKLQAVMERYHM